jgi:hypothetical protein
MASGLKKTLGIILSREKIQKTFKNYFEIINYEKSI